MADVLHKKQAKTKEKCKQLPHTWKTDPKVYERKIIRAWMLQLQNYLAICHTFWICKSFSSIIASEEVRNEKLERRSFASSKATSFFNCLISSLSEITCILSTFARAFKTVPAKIAWNTWLHWHGTWPTAYHVYLSPICNFFGTRSKEKGIPCLLHMSVWWTHRADDRSPGIASKWVLQNARQFWVSVRNMARFQPVWFTVSTADCS